MQHQVLNFIHMFTYDYFKPNVDRLTDSCYFWLQHKLFNQK